MCMRNASVWVAAMPARRSTAATDLHWAGRLHCSHVQVLFSSVASLLGSAGQAGYAAANGGLDTLSGAWRRAGTPVNTVQWGAWAGSGMAATRVTEVYPIASQGDMTFDPNRTLAQPIPYTLRSPKHPGYACIKPCERIARQVSRHLRDSHITDCMLQCRSGCGAPAWVP